MSCYIDEEVNDNKECVTKKKWKTIYSWSSYICWILLVLVVVYLFILVYIWKKGGDEYSIFVWVLGILYIIYISIVIYISFKKKDATRYDPKSGPGIIQYLGNYGVPITNSVTLFFIGIAFTFILLGCSIILHIKSENLDPPPGSSLGPLTGVL